MLDIHKAFIVGCNLYRGPISYTNNIIQHLVTCHIHQNIAMFIRQQAFGPWGTRGQSSCKNPDKILHGDFVATVINLDVITIDIDLFIGIVEDSG